MLFNSAVLHPTTLTGGILFYEEHPAKTPDGMSQLALADIRKRRKFCRVEHISIFPVHLGVVKGHRNKPYDRWIDLTFFSLHLISKFTFADMVR